MTAPGSVQDTRRRLVRAIALAIALGGLLACGEGEAPAPDPARASQPAPLVVSLTPLATRFALAIGAGHLLVAVDEASSRIPGLDELPVVDLPGVGPLAPDLVLLPTAPVADDPVVRQLRSAGTTLIEFAPHDLEDVFVLCREVGHRLVGEARAQRFERGLTRPLAALGGSSFGQARPRVVAVVGFDPIELAGGHSFETDLIEIAGGQSVTHGGEQTRVQVGAGGWPELAPDLILVTAPTEPTAEQRSAAMEALPSGHPIEFFAFDPELFWLRRPVETARRLRSLIEPLARELGEPR